jgi:hypothetical protein
MVSPIRNTAVTGDTPVSPMKVSTHRAGDAGCFDCAASNQWRKNSVQSDQENCID